MYLPYTEDSEPPSWHAGAGPALKDEYCHVHSALSGHGQSVREQRGAASRTYSDSISGKMLDGRSMNTFQGSCFLGTDLRWRTVGVYVCLPVLVQ